ncbi:MAG: nickel pincer cofactor biosynthesis protein LarC [Planctomycetaceae bacterium]|nr:nickel pincer cofactor biosynthesis protein LarC [Planctomycetaceae bacterium]
MKIAWLECATGISGDMTLGALIDLGVDLKAIREAVESLHLPDVVLRVETVIKNGFRSTHVLVDHPEQHAHRHYSDICAILDQSALTETQKHLAQRLFLAVAESEARVHGSTVEQVHFHEVGAVDSIVDIVGVAVAFDLLGVDRIVCSPVPTGRGFVHIDHGICPVPAPGTAEILKGVPLADIPVEAELTTPTGAAIVKTLADSFGPLPAMTIEQVGYGAGTMTFPQRANVLRIFVGHCTPEPGVEYVSLLETNLDDVSPEVIGHTRSRLMDGGALDVYSLAIDSKKDRPGTLLSVICRPETCDGLEAIVFAETKTLGIRRTLVERRTQNRRICQVQTPWGTVGGKVAWRTGYSAAFSPEFEDCAKVARQHGVPLREVYLAAESAFQQSGQSATMTPLSGADRLADSQDSHSHDHDGHTHDSHTQDGHTHDSHSHDHDHHGHDHH